MVLLQLVLPLVVQGLLQQDDWLVGRAPENARLEKDAQGRLILTNGLVSRTFVTEPNWATISLRSE
eukprot:6183855-Pleurochrysis_carterae.AAC.1